MTAPHLPRRPTSPRQTAGATAPPSHRQSASTAARGDEDAEDDKSDDGGGDDEDDDGDDDDDSEEEDDDEVAEAALLAKMRGLLPTSVRVAERQDREGAHVQVRRDLKGRLDQPMDQPGLRAIHQETWRAVSK